MSSVSALLAIQKIQNLIIPFVLPLDPATIDIVVNGAFKYA